MTDAQLVADIRRDDQVAYRSLYERYADAIFRFLWRKTRDRETAEDLVQECFVRLWNHRAKLDDQQSIKAWCYQVANNLAIDHLRKKVSGLEQVDTDWEAQMGTTSLDEEAFQRRERIRQAVADLPVSQRQVFWLCRYEGLKYAEAAQVLEISIKTVENHMNRALKKLRGSLKELFIHMACLLFL